MFLQDCKYVIDVPEPNPRTSVERRDGRLFKLSHEKVIAIIGDDGEPMASPSLRA